MTARRTAEQTPRWTDYVYLDEILRAPRNPKRHNHDMIAASMSRFGVVELPTLDERTGRIVAGHGRLDDWERRRDAGEDPPDGIVVDDDGRWKVPLIRGWASRSDADAEGYLVVSNQSTIAGGWDDPALADLLDDLRRADAELLSLTGFDDKWVDSNLAGTDGVEAPDDFAEFDPATISTQHQCPACGYRWSGSSAPRETSDEDDDDGSGFGPLAQAH